MPLAGIFRLDRHQFQIFTTILTRWGFHQVETLYQINAIDRTMDRQQECLQMFNFEGISFRRFTFFKLLLLLLLQIRFGKSHFENLLIRYIFWPH